MSGSCPGGPVSKVDVVREDRYVRVRHTFCCKLHYAVPWVETLHTPEGAMKLARDLVVRALEALRLPPDA